MASSAMDAAVDIIRRKIYGLKKEAVQEVAKVEELENVTRESNEAATENEKKLRELMKAVSKKDNEVDLAADKLEATEKKIRVAEVNLKKSKDDLILLKDLVVKREIDLRNTEEEATRKNELLQGVTKRSDQSEKSRKELENRCNFYDERIDAVEKEVMTAKRTTMDACEKYEETSEKVNRKEKALAKTEIRARAATDESSKVEADVNRMSLQLGDRENSREKAIARTEQLAKKIKQLQAQVREAENRADQMDQDKERMEFVLEQTKREKESVVKKVEDSKVKLKQQQAQLQRQQQ